MKIFNYVDASLDQSLFSDCTRTLQCRTDNGFVLCHEEIMR
jgi:hypothetical protein